MRCHERLTPAGSIGFTRRAGATRLTHTSIGDMLKEFPTSIPNMTLGPSPAEVQVQSHGTTALVFGREENGLTEQETRLCSHACAIPTGRIQPSMNLSHAVSVVLSEVRGGMHIAAGRDRLFQHL